MTGQILKQWFWDCYDHLGRLIAANLLLFFTLGPAAWFSLALFNQMAANAPPALAALMLFLFIAGVGPVLMALWMAPVGYFAGFVSAEKDPPFRAFLRVFRHTFARCWWFLQILVTIFAILLVNFWFYTMGGFFEGGLKFVGYALAGLCFWTALLAGVIGFVGLPWVAREDGVAARQAIRMAMHMIMRFPTVVAPICFVLLLLWVFCFITRLAGLVIFGLVGTVMLANSLRDVLEERLRQPAPGTDETPAPGSWHQVQAREKTEEAERMRKSRYERTFRDLLRPWEM